MRKRLVIGAIAIVVIGVAAYVLSQPKKGTVEWHKRKYLAAVYSPVTRWLVDYGPVRTRTAAAKDRERRIDEHRAALVGLGYLVKNTFIVSNRPHAVRDKILPMCGIEVFRTEAVRLPDDVRFFTYEMATNSITVWCQQDQTSTWQDLIRQADVPETK